MSSWNAGYTQLIRRGRRAHWGNWALNAKITPGAVGTVDPASGEFALVADSVPGAQVQSTAQPSKWQLMSEHVSRQQGDVSGGASGTDPDTGTEVAGTMTITWGLDKAGSMVSEFSIASEASLVDFGSLLTTQFDWLAGKAATVGMGTDGGISQGFGVVTSVLYANSGLNVAAQSDSTTFSISGEATAVNDLVGAQGQAKGSYSSAVSNKSVDKHIWPDTENTVASDPVPIAFTFASFDGRLIMPNWTSDVGAFQLVLNNQHGGTYIVEANLTYNTNGSSKSESAKVSGGLISTIGAIPLDAKNLKLNLTFKGMFSDEHKSFQWATPLGQWYDGTRHIDLTGVWPGQTGAVDAEAALAP